MRLPVDEEHKAAEPIKGRGAIGNVADRFDHPRSVRESDGWDLDDEMPSAPSTTVSAESARTILTRNRSPDLGFEQSINPYRGCEHGCIYCYARASHAYLGLSPGLDFETRLFHKPDAPALLERELRRPGYRPSMVVIGANTDPYQPVERRLRLTRSILEVLAAFRHPVGIITRGTLIERDLDLLAPMARAGLLQVGISLTTLDPDLKRRMEPRAPAAAARLRTMRGLAEAGVPVRVMASPIIPVLNEAELEHLLAAAAEVGASSASYALLRLPHEVEPLFVEWLRAHFPDRAEHVLSRLRQARGGALHDAFRTPVPGRGRVCTPAGAALSPRLPPVRAADGPSGAGSDGLPPAADGRRSARSAVDRGRCCVASVDLHLDPDRKGGRGPLSCIRAGALPPPRGLKSTLDTDTQTHDKTAAGHPCSRRRYCF
jgi:DNA repair photolyase